MPYVLDYIFYNRTKFETKFCMHCTNKTYKFMSAKNDLVKPPNCLNSMEEEKKTHTHTHDGNGKSSSGVNAWGLGVCVCVLHHIQHTKYLE